MNTQGSNGTPSVQTNQVIAESPSGSGSSSANPYLSLDLQATLLGFFRVVQKALNLSGVAYHFTAKRLQFDFGETDIHSARYQLQIGDSAIGELSTYCSRSMNETELTTLENHISQLIYPLRNALLYKEAVENSLRDPLTRVGNRAAMELTLQREVNLLERTGDSLSLLVIDIDHFKPINDNYGHSFGDRAICAVADGISRVLRQTDQVYRFGGEEFVVILTGTAHQAALLVAERVRREIEAIELANGQQPVRLTASLGVSTSSEKDTRDSLIDRADCALYLAKMTGRNRVISQTREGDLPATALSAS